MNVPSYTVLAQRYRNKRTFYGQLERIEHDTMRIVTLFRCQHRHRTMDGAEHCWEVNWYRSRDLDTFLASPEVAR